MHETVYDVAKEAIGRTKRKHADWFDDNNEQIEPLINKKRLAITASLQNPNDINLKNEFRKCKADLQRELRAMENEWWHMKAEDI